MRTSAKRMALCAMLAAVGVVLMVLGAALELGIYACPLLVGLCFTGVGKTYGVRYHIILYVVTSVLCFMLVPNIEENLVFAGFFGWYPIVRPYLQKLPKFPGWLLKFAVFNAAILLVEWLVITVFAPEAMPDALIWALLLLGNVTFLVYDLAIPRISGLLEKLMKI